MNTNEFKDLNTSFLSKLKKECQKVNSDCGVLGKGNGELHIGIWYEESPNFKEVYLLRNNGNVADWKFIGVHNG